MTDRDLNARAFARPSQLVRSRSDGYGTRLPSDPEIAAANERAYAQRLADHTARIRAKLGITEGV